MRGSCAAGEPAGEGKGVERDAVLGEGVAHGLLERPVIEGTPLEDETRASGDEGLGGHPQAVQQRLTFEAPFPEAARASVFGVGLAG